MKPLTNSLITGTTQAAMYYYTLNGVLSLFGPYRWSLSVPSTWNLAASASQLLPMLLLRGYVCTKMLRVSHH